MFVNYQQLLSFDSFMDWSLVGWLNIFTLDFLLTQEDKRFISQDHNFLYPCENGAAGAKSFILLEYSKVNVKKVMF